jgi:integrase
MPTLSATSGRKLRDVGSPTFVTVGAGVEQFLQRRDLRPRSRIIYGQTLGRLVAAVGAEASLGDLDHDIVQALMDQWHAGAAPATWNLNLASIRSFISFAQRQRWLEEDPTAGIERRQVRTNPDLRVIARTDLEAIWRRVDIPLREKTLWRLLYDTAARADEVLGLDIADVRLGHKAALVVSKGGASRTVNWYTHTAHLLARYTAGRVAGPLFLAHRRPRRPVPTSDRDPATGRARLSYRRAAELFTATTGWTLHQLRHTRIRELKDAGCPLPILQKITGHASLRTLTEHYPGPSPEAVRGWYSATDPAARGQGLKKLSEYG